MNRARWITTAATFLALWLLGALVLASGLQGRLETAARAALAADATLHRRLSRVAVAFAGQQARLSGTVRTQQDREAVARLIQHQVHAPLPLLGPLGLRFNPVASIRNEVEVSPFPPGWLLLAATGAEARLLGSTANEFEARDLARSLQEAWSAKGGKMRGTPRIDGENHDEAGAVGPTLRGVPGPRPEAALHVARIGGPWLTLSLDRPDSGLQADLLRQGVTETEWQDQVLPALRHLRAAHEEQRGTAAEQRRLAALPPGHLFIATRDTAVTLRGEVGSEALKQALLAEALQVFGAFRVHDQIRVSPLRRPGDSFPPLTTALLPSGQKSQEKSLFLGFNHSAWKAVDWRPDASPAKTWEDALPQGLHAGLASEDHAAILAWLQSPAAPAPPAGTRPAFITLALLDGKAILCGQVAEESTRLQVIAAARQAYAPRMRVMHDSLRVDGQCRPFQEALHAAKGLPPPPFPPLEAVFALAVPAESWVTLPVTPDLVEAGGLHRTGRFSPALPAALVEDRSQEALEHLRVWLARQRPHSQLARPSPPSSQPALR